MRSQLKKIYNYLDEHVLLHHLDKETRGIILARQIGEIVRLTPAMMLGNIVISGIMYFEASRQGHTGFVTVWFMTVWVMIVAAMNGWRKSLTVKEITYASSRALRRVMFNAFLLGTLWGTFPALVLPTAGANLQLLIGIGLAGMLCGAGFALATIPQAVFAFIVPCVLGTTIGAAQGDLPFVEQLMIMGGTFTGIIFFASTKHCRRFVSHHISEEKIEEQRNIIDLLLKEFEDNSSDWLWETDANGKFTRVSPRFAKAAGMEIVDIVGKEFSELFCTLSQTEEMELVAKKFAARETFRDRELMLRIAAEERWWKLTGKPTYDKRDQFEGYLGVGTDISSQKVAASQIQFLAHNDHLTGLMNRGQFTQQLSKYVSRLERYGTPFSVLYLDLDQFKAVNDTRGHLAGDHLLSEVGKRLLDTLRDTDIVSRLGGDEFAVLLDNNASRENAAEVAQKIIKLLSKPYGYEDQELQIGVSVGIALAPINGTRPDQILRNADLALYRAKREGKGTFKFFESNMDSEAREQRMLAKELADAPRNDELTLYFQPFIDAKSEKTVGFEALIRWHHPIRGVVSPGEFIPIAEQSGLIGEIDIWTLREACRQASQWPEHLRVAVNLSAQHFQDEAIVETVKDALAKSGLAPHRLEIELTETLLVDQSKHLRQLLQQLKEIGIALAMDDFGTGYSSLSYLLKFPFDRIKIDRSFVAAIGTDSAASDILKTITVLGKTLNMEITAEGVETKEQLSFLKKIAVEQLQGYYFAKPLDEEKLIDYIAELDQGTAINAVA